MQRQQQGKERRQQQVTSQQSSLQQSQQDSDDVNDHDVNKGIWSLLYHILAAVKIMVSQTASIITSLAGLSGDIDNSISNGNAALLQQLEAYLNVKFGIFGQPTSTYTNNIVNGFRNIPPSGGILYSGGSGGISIIPLGSITISPPSDINQFFTDLAYSDLTISYISSQLALGNTVTLNVVGITNPDGSPAQIIINEPSLHDKVEIFNTSRSVTLFANTVLTLA